MVEVPSDMVGLEAANAQLEQMISADAATATAAGVATKVDQSAAAALEQPGQRAAQPGEQQPKKPNLSSSDTPAAADQQPPKDQQQQKPADQQPAKEPTKYEKARARQDSAWKQINSDKEAIRIEREKLAAERQEFTTQQQTAAAKYSPDQYEEAAKQFDKQGKFEMAEAARAHAAELRKNPPPTPQQAVVLRQQQEQQEKSMKEWCAKAAIDYPAVARIGAPENAALREFLQKEPETLRSPKGMYYASRLVNAETASARVPGMEKELGELRAKVKELEGLTAPPPPSIPQRLGDAQRSDADELAELEATALSLGPLR